MLADNRFSECHYISDGLPAIRYTYETHKAIFDVDVFDGEPHFRTNCTPSAKHRIHSEIEKHFNLTWS